MRPSCAICGFPRTGAGACAACGGLETRAPKGLAPQRLVFHGPHPGDHPHLQPAFAAWQHRDFVRYVGQCLLAMRLPSSLSKRLPEGHGFAVPVAATPLFVVLEEAQDRIAVEAPVVLVPEGDDAPICRAILELNLALPRGARLCLRGDVVVLRFCDETARVPPPRLVHAIEDVATGASMLGEVLGFRFGARQLQLDAQSQVRGVDFTLRGEPRTLRVLR